MKTVLIVEDDKDHLKALQIRLGAAGFGTIWASDGLQAVAAARRERPDVIVLDLGIPGGDGYQVLQRLKMIAPTANIPIIVLSARDPAVHRARSLEAGAVAFFQKPADSDALLKAIHGSCASEKA
jgi:two-component system phosphate regulon response regulator PhoB